MSNTYQGRGRSGPVRGGFSQGRGGPPSARGGYPQNRGGRQQQAAPSSGEVFTQREYDLNPHVDANEESLTRTEPEDAFRSLRLHDETSQPQRPAYGTKGTKLILFANYIELKTKKDSITFHRYSISNLDTDESKKPKGRKLKRLVELLLEELGRTVEGGRIVSDFSSIIISSKKLVDKKKAVVNKKSTKSQDTANSNDFSKEFSIVYRDEDNKQDRQVRTYRFLVQYNRSLSLDDVLQYLSDINLSLPEASLKQDIIQAVNIIIGHGLRIDPRIISQAQKFYLPPGPGQDSTALGSAILSLRGYQFSIRSAASRLLLNIQVRHGYYYRPQTLKALYKELGIDATANEQKLRSSEYRIKGLKVKVTHFEPHRNKTIIGFAHPDDGADSQYPPEVPSIGATAKKVKFRYTQKDGKSTMITVAEYFHRMYNKIVEDLPVVNTGSRRDPKYTVAEVCYVPEGVPFKGRLDPEQTKNMIDFAVRGPADNANSIAKKGWGLLCDHFRADMPAFELTMVNQLVRVHARKLPSPPVRYGSRKQSSGTTLSIENGSWNLRDIQPIDGKQMPKWSVLLIQINSVRCPIQSLKHLEDQAKAFQESIKNIGLQVMASQQARRVSVDHESEVPGQVDAVFRAEAQKADGASVRLFLVLLPNYSSVIYNAVKRCGDIKYGIHTVCVQATKFVAKDNRSNDQYWQNVGLKINLKLGGRNQELQKTDLGCIADGRTMVVGLDVTHPAPGEDKAPSIACIVASIDKHFTQWPAHTHIQERRKEMVLVIKSMFKSRLKCWYENNNKALPDQILIYRDGVGEGQYQLVLNQELPQIREACKEMYPADQTKKNLPRITIVIVGKRHNTRFYPTKKEDADSNGNIKNGTIVDRSVTETRTWDFFLAAHTAMKGTTRPAHYVVIHDEIFSYVAKSIKSREDTRSDGQKAVDELEKITHNLCYLFGRATKAVSICPPAYYADIACERARRWMSRFYTDYSSTTESMIDAQESEVQVHARLRDTMYYI